MTAVGDYAERGAGCAAGGSADPSHFRSAGTLIHPKLLFVWPPNCRRTGWMVGPTATESLIKAAAAGEGAREGGGARGKEWKEVGGNTGPRPPNPSRCARLPREPGWPGVQDQEPRIDPGPGGCGAPSVSCSLEERKKLGVLGRKSTLGPTTLSRTLGALHTSQHPSFGPHHPSSAHLSVSQRGIQYPGGELRGLTAVCAASRRISLTGGWAGGRWGRGGRKRRWRGRLGRGAAPGQGSRAAEASLQRLWPDGHLRGNLYPLPAGLGALLCPLGAGAVL